MVRILQLRRTVVMACLLAHTAVCLTPVPLTVEDVKTIYSDLTGQTREASTAAKTIDPGYSFILYGLTRSGPVKDFLDLLHPIDTRLEATSVSLDELITKPLNSSTIVDGDNPPREIYNLHRELTKEVRILFRSLKRQSTGISCTLLGLLPLSSCRTRAWEVRGVLEEFEGALWSFRSAVQKYDFLYGAEIQDDWVLYTLGDITAAIDMYDQFKPKE